MTRQQWIDKFLNGVNDIANIVVAISKENKVGTLTALTVAGHNDPTLAGVMISSLHNRMYDAMKDPKDTIPGVALIKELYLYVKVVE